MKGLDTRYEDVDLVIVRENTEDLYAGIEHMVGPRRRREHQDHHPRRVGADRPVRLRLRGRQRPAQGDRGPQGQHHEAVRRPVPRELPDRRRGLRGPDRVRGPHRRQHVHAARPEARAVRRPRAARTCTATSSATSRPGWSAGSAWRRAPTSAPRPPSSSRSTARRPSTPGQNKANPTALILSGALMLRHLGYPEAGRPASRRPSATSSPRAGRSPTTWAARPARSQFADAVIERLAAAAAAAMTGLAGQPAGLPAQAAGNGPAGLGRDQAARRLVRWRRASRRRCSRSCATYLFVSGILFTPLFGTPYEVGRLPLAAVLAADRARVAADLAQPGPVHPVDPARLPGHLLLLPQGLLPLLLRRSARLRGGGAAVHRRYAMETRVPVHPPEPPPLLPVSRVHPAVLPVGRRGPRVRPGGRSRSGSGVGGPVRQRVPADRVLAVVPLPPAHRRRTAGLLLVHAPDEGPLHRCGSASRR